MTAPQVHTIDCPRGIVHRDGEPLYRGHLDVYTCVEYDPGFWGIESDPTAVIALPEITDGKLVLLGFALLLIFKRLDRYRGSDHGRITCTGTDQET